MRASLTHRFLATVAAVGALTLALGAQSGSAQVQHGAPGVITGGLPDITVSVGYIGHKKWTDGGVVVLDDPSVVIATQVGPNKDMCRFIQMDYQPGNLGTGDAAGPSVGKVYRENTVVNTDAFPGGNFAAGQWRPFEKWQMELKEGMNSVRVVVDANKQVAESNESNTFGSRINVKIDCNGDGSIAGVPGGLKQAPRNPTPDPAPARTLRLKPAN